MRTGCYTALVTPMQGDEVDYEGLSALVDFQIQSGITGILAVGTTGESPTLTWEEHEKVIEIVVGKCKGRVLSIAGTGSNNTFEALSATRHAAECGADAALLVDPYYNGPSSLEIRKEYLEPIAAAVPEMEIIPYVIPGRTGAQLLPEDVALLSRKFKNIKCVKEATGKLDNMRRTRECCGKDFMILSGDDALTFPMMTDESIGASGVISVLSNVAPFFVTEMTRCIAEKRLDEAKKLLSDLSPLFDLVTVTTMEETPFGEVTCRARNPLGLKTLMQLLGMPSGPCRRPLGKMTRRGFDFVLSKARETHGRNPNILKAVGEFFKVDIDERLNNEALWSSLFYENID